MLVVRSASTVTSRPAGNAACNWGRRAFIASTVEMTLQRCCDHLTDDFGTCARIQRRHLDRGISGIVQRRYDRNVNLSGER